MVIQDSSCTLSLKCHIVIHSHGGGRERGYLSLAIPSPRQRQGLVEAPGVMHRAPHSFNEDARSIVQWSYVIARE